MDAKIHGIDGIRTMKLLQPHQVHLNHLKYQMSLYHAICVIRYRYADDAKEKGRERENEYSD